MWRDLFICVTWLVHMCDMTRSYVFHNEFTIHMCALYLVHMCDMTRLRAWHDSFISATTHFISQLLIVRYCQLCTNTPCVTWLIHTCDMTRSCMWHVSFICVTWIFHVCDTTHLLVWHDLFYLWSAHRQILPATAPHAHSPWGMMSRATWLVLVCDMPHSYTRATWLVLRDMTSCARAHPVRW